MPRRHVHSPAAARTEARHLILPPGRLGSLGLASLGLASLGLASLGLASLALIAGCRPPSPPPPPPPVELPVPEIDPWPGVLAQAQRLADAGDYAEADRVLARYAMEHQGTRDGAEADFWRALFKVDPLNRGVTTREKLAALDTYLHAGPSMPRYVEAQILRRLVEAIDSTRTVVAAVQDSASARATARDDEVRRISEELDKAVAELERIRRRLTPRPPDRPPPR